VAAAIAATLRAAGERVAAYKPVLTGTDDPAAAGWPPDDEVLGAAAGRPAEEVVARRFGPAVSPHLAAALAGETLEVDELVAEARRVAAGADALVAEGVGGLLVPLSGRASVRDLAVALGLPLVVAARPGLGTINHTLLTLEAARSAGLRVSAVVLGPWPSVPDAMQLSNRRTIERLGKVPVAVLPRSASGSPSDLLAAAAGLPVAEWLA
jgi:dethiobiotin synthetase